MTTVVLVERHAGLRNNIVLLLAENPALTLAAEAAFAAELLPRCRDANWDVAILGVTGADQSGPDSLRALRRYCPALRFVVVTFALAYRHLHECLNAGALGLVASEDVDAELVPALHAVAGGQPYLSRGVEAALDENPD